MKPPANESPAPVGSNTLSSGYAGAKKIALRVEHERAVLAFLDDHVLGPALHDPPRGLHEIRLFGELARLAVVERDHVDFLEQREQIGAPALDPEVHRVARDELRLAHLAQHLELQARIDVAEEDERRVAELLGDLRREVREHAELRLERLGRVEVVAVAAAPAERLALGVLEPREIDAARGERARAARPDSRCRRCRPPAPS